MTSQKKCESSDYILYIGQYLNEEIVKQRELPTFNVAGSNRMYRLANALRIANQRLLLVSPAASLRMRWSGELRHRFSIQKAGRVPVFFCPTLGLPIINALLEPITLLWSIIILSKRVDIRAAILYNFSPSIVIVGLFLKYILGIRVFSNIEDIYKPSLNDWNRVSEVMPVRQIIYSICMKIVSFLADGFIIPTKRFLSYLPSEKPSLIVSGCMPFENVTGDFKKIEFPINILFAGKIGFDHGIQFFIDALDLLQSDLACTIKSSLTINICGAGLKADWLRKRISDFKDLPITYFGFVNAEHYKKLLNTADICVALQDPQGRHGNYKTPSKVYEYLGYGKLVVATPVGDLTDLPSQAIEICSSDVRKSLYCILRKLIIHPELIHERQEFAAQYARDNFTFQEVGSTLKSFILAK